MCKCILSPTATKIYACTLLPQFITGHISLSFHEDFTKQTHIYLWLRLPLDCYSSMVYSAWFKSAFLICMYPHLLNSYAWLSALPLADMCMHSSNPSQMHPSSFFCKCAYPTYDSCMFKINISFSSQALYLFYL